MKSCDRKEVRISSAEELREAFNPCNWSEDTQKKDIIFISNCEEVTKEAIQEYVSDYYADYAIGKVYYCYNNDNEEELKILIIENTKIINQPESVVNIKYLDKTQPKYNTI
jgi:hypothetical protein